MMMVWRHAHNALIAPSESAKIAIINLPPYYISALLTNDETLQFNVLFPSGGGTQTVLNLANQNNEL